MTKLTQNQLNEWQGVFYSLAATGACSKQQAQALVNLLDPAIANVTTTNVGAANTGVTAVEYGDQFNHRTVLTVSQAAAVTLADNASLADGYLLYTLPAGAIIVRNAYMALTFTNAEHDAEACDIGLGTTIGTGAVAVLGGTAGFENILTGQTGAIGTEEVAQDICDSASALGGLIIGASDPHIVHANVAAAWADTAGAALDADLAGTVVLDWSLVL